LTYVNSLDPQRDRYFRDQLVSTAQIHRETVTQRAETAFAAADQAWASYQSNGKLTFLQLQSPEVSKHYRQRADELTNAYRQAASSVALYRLVQPEVPSNSLSLLRETESEIKLQRRSLRELRGVVQEKVLQEKLALLPDTAPGEAPIDGGSS
jgi:hypothetical protein